MDASTLALATDLTRELSRRQLVGSYRVSVRTLQFIHRIIRSHTAHIHSAADLSLLVRQLGQLLVAAAPQELAIGNIIRRVLAIVYAESGMKNSGASTSGNDVEEGNSLQGLLGREEGVSPVRRERKMEDVVPSILGEIEELVGELEGVNAQVADQALEHIHASEVILTYWKSSTVAQFLIEASKIRQFQVYVVESAPSFEGQSQALDLSAKGLDTTLITDSAVFAVMSGVNKVIVGAHAVLANGGILAHVGAYNLALAASKYSVPFVVVTGLYKLCPMFAFNQDTFNDQNPPTDVLPFEEGCISGLEIENPAYEYIPPEYVTLFVTNE
jgi:translation initiation factor eIF-2B subunit beta